MADTTRSVKLRIVADAGTAKATLDDIAEKADNIDGKSSSVRVNIQPGTTREQLDEITAKADALGIKRVTFSVRANTKPAEESVDSLRIKLVKLAAEADAADAGSKLLSTGLLALAPAIAPIGAAAVGIGGALLPALVAGGAGFGVFAVAAKGAFAEVAKADTKNKQLTGGLGELQRALNGAKKDWQSFIAGAAGGIGHTLAPVLNTVPTLLRYAGELLKPAEQGIRVLATQLRGAFQSRGAQDFVQRLAQMVTPAIISLGDAAGHVAHGIGGLFKDLMPHAQNIELAISKVAGEFDRWANSAKAGSGIQHLFDYVNQNAPKFRQILSELASEIPKVVSALSSFGSGSLSGISVILQVIGKLSPGQLQAIAAGFVLMRTATSLYQVGITAAAGATKVWSGIQLAFNAVMDANPVSLIVIGIAALIAIIAVVATKTKFFQTIWDASWGFIKDTFDKVFGWIKSHWSLILNILIGPIGIAAKFIIQHWNAIVSGAASMVGGIVRFVGSIPGKIVNALSALYNDMLNTGKNIVIGIWNGITSLGSWLWGQIVNFVKSFIMSPVKSVLSMFSPSRVFHGYGKNIVLGLVDGISDHAHLAAAAAGGLANSVMRGFSLPTGALAPGGLARGMSGGNTIHAHITVHGVVGDAGATGREIAKALNEYLRQTGQAQLVGV